VQIIEINHDRTNKKLGSTIFRFELEFPAESIDISPDWRHLLVMVGTASKWINIYDISDMKNLSQTPAYRIRGNIGSEIREARFHESKQAILIRRDHVIHLFQIDLTDKTEIATLPISQYIFRKKLYYEIPDDPGPNKTRKCIVEEEDMLSSVYVQKLGKTEHPPPFIILGSREGSLTVVKDMDTHRRTCLTSTITPSCVIDKEDDPPRVHIGENHENIFVQTK
jgi:hypothetical protein